MTNLLPVAAHSLAMAVAQAAEHTVANYQELGNAVAAAAPGDLVLLKDGVYPIEGDFAISVRTDHLTIRGESGDRSQVVVEGQGMAGAIHHGFRVSSDDVIIEDLTVRRVHNHCIQTDVDAGYLTDNLADRAIASRDGGSGTLLNNRNAASADWFVDAARGDLHLTAQAIHALDQGSGLPDLTTDFDGDNRSSQGSPDRGADEYRGPLALVPALLADHRFVI